MEVLEFWLLANNCHMIWNTKNQVFLTMLLHVSAMHNMCFTIVQFVFFETFPSISKNGNLGVSWGCKSVAFQCGAL